MGKFELPPHVVKLERLKMKGPQTFDNPDEVRTTLKEVFDSPIKFARLEMLFPQISESEFRKIELFARSRTPRCKESYEQFVDTLQEKFKSPAALLRELAIPGKLGI